MLAAALLAWAAAPSSADDVGVAGVQFQLDSSKLGAELSSSPYQTSWNTSGVQDGQHVLTAVARDASGKTTASASRASR